MLIFAGTTLGQTGYNFGVQKWRVEHENELKADTGWLTVVGLFWLKDGNNTIGSGAGFDIELTENFKTGNFGVIEFKNGKGVLTVGEGVEATVDGNAVQRVELRSDENGKPNVVKTGTQSFYLIKRENRYGIRLKDTNSKPRREFTHSKWYGIDPKLRVTAKFERYAEQTEVSIPKVMGGDFKMKSPGLVKFKLNGQPVRLQTVDEGDGRLFIIFRDLTSKTTTYGAGRFLYADKPEGDTAVLDFNKAENPPCAFTSFATCPVAPKQNRLELEIRAGEKRYHQ
ncbi:DUF1684 domain-containing protein [soil metagenome]